MRRRAAPPLRSVALERGQRNSRLPRPAVTGSAQQRGRFRGPPGGYSVTIRPRRRRGAALLLSSRCRPRPAAPPRVPPLRRSRRLGDTTQRAAEPAWHRRARRARGAARALLRVAAASRLLAGHHSAQRTPAVAMPVRPRGGGDGQRGGGQLARLEAKLAEMEERLNKTQCGQGKGGGGKAAGAEGKGRGGGVAQQQRWGGGNAVEGRPGDWRCRQCHAYPCFARARRCYKCGEPRGAASDLSALRERSTYLGPIGAGGARPMLGNRAMPQKSTGGQMARAGSDASPTMRVPGASVAAAAEAERHRRPLGRWAEGSPRAQGNGDGVRPARSGTTPGTGATGQEVGGGAMSVDKGIITTRNSWAALSEEEEDDDCDGMDTDGPPQRAAPEDDADGRDDEHGDQGDGEGYEAEEDGGDDGDAQEVIDEAELRRVWQEHCHACKVMERNARDFPPRLLEEAKALRDSAERQWRAAKQPQPLHKRLRWAEGALRDAEDKENAQHQELRRHNEEAEQRRKEIEGRIAVAAARTARKRAALDALRHEAAPRTCTLASERATKMAATGIASEVAPPLAAVIERLAMPLGDDAEAVRQQLQLVAVSLSRVEGVLRDGTAASGGGGPPVCYDIGDATNDGTTDEGGTGDPGKGDAARGHGGGLERSAGGSSTRWAKQSEHGMWRKSGATTSNSAVEEARRMLQEREPHASVVGPRGTAAAGPGAPLPRSSDTNDLAEAARRDARTAEQQIQAAQLLSQTARCDQQLHHEEAQRQQRLQGQQDEIRRHQDAMQMAAQQRAAEEARQREALIASMSPQELARAMELQAQQAAIGAQVFGTQSASQLAGMVQQAEIQRAEQAEVQRIMESSQEELLAMQGGESGACPW